MPGTVAGGKRAANKNLQKTGMYIDGVWTTIEKGTFYEHIGASGGRNSHGGGFAANRELAKAAGRKGGKAKRNKSNAPA